MRGLRRIRGTVKSDNARGGNWTRAGRTPEVTGRRVSNPEKPDRDDGTEHGQAGNRPARRVTRTIGFRPVDHVVMPIGHNRLLAIASDRYVSASGLEVHGTNPFLSRLFRRTGRGRVKKAIRWPAGSQITDP